MAPDHPEWHEPAGERKAAACDHRDLEWIGDLGRRESRSVRAVFIQIAGPGATLTWLTDHTVLAGPLEIVREVALVPGDSESLRPRREPDRRDEPRGMSVDREVLQLARSGAVHPDPRVAAN